MFLRIIKSFWYKRKGKTQNTILASELAKHLNELVQEYGDRDVVINDHKTILKPIKYVYLDRFEGDIIIESGNENNS